MSYWMEIQNGKGLGLHTLRTLETLARAAEIIEETQGNNDFFQPYAEQYKKSHPDVWQLLEQHQFNFGKLAESLAPDCPLTENDWPPVGFAMIKVDLETGVVTAKQENWGNNDIETGASENLAEALSYFVEPGTFVTIEIDDEDPYQEAALVLGQGSVVTLKAMWIDESGHAWGDVNF